MAISSVPISVTISAEQLNELNRNLSSMRHDINNHLSLIMASLELIRYKPQMAEKMLASVSEQPAKINAAMVKFSAEFERILNLPRG
jgi:hypothetical protein